MTDATVRTAADVLARVDRAWRELEETLAGLGPQELAEVRDAAGWAVKDHLAHLAAWEGALVARLDGRPEHEALGLDGATLGTDEDAENAAIFALHRDQPLHEVLDAVRAEHARTRARIERLGDAELAGGDGPGARPVAAWIAGNTWEHYAQHLGWIRELIGPRADS
jgi:hypothetical protein